MAAKQELFESVRAVVSGRLRDESQVRELAMRVAEESTALRRRVERAVEYARKGLRLEACAEAEAEPNVFPIDPSLAVGQVARLKKFKSDRDQARVTSAL